MSDERVKRADLTDRASGRTIVHLSGYYGDSGENEGVLAISAALDPGPAYPIVGRIIVGSPSRSPLIEGYIPNLGGFSCSPDAADALADELKRAAADARMAADACPHGNMPREAGAGHWREWHRGHGCNLDPDRQPTEPKP